MKAMCVLWAICMWILPVTAQESTTLSVALTWNSDKSEMTRMIEGLVKHHYITFGHIGPNYDQVGNHEAELIIENDGWEFHVRAKALNTNYDSAEWAFFEYEIIRLDGAPKRASELVKSSLKDIFLKFAKTPLLSSTEALSNSLKNYDWAIIDTVLSDRPFSYKESTASNRSRYDKSQSVLPVFFAASGHYLDIQFVMKFSEQSGYELELILPEFGPVILGVTAKSIYPKRTIIPEEEDDFGDCTPRDIAINVIFNVMVDRIYGRDQVYETRKKIKQSFEVLNKTLK